MPAAAPTFNDGETIEWVERDGNTNNIKPVKFIGTVGKSRAHVQFGINSGTFSPNIFEVPLAELRRPQPAEPIYTSPRPTAPSPLTPLAAHRKRLRLAHAAAREANELVALAEAAADRATAALGTARAALARYAERELAATERFTAALRRPNAARKSSTVDCADAAAAKLYDREAARRRCAAAEGAAAQLDRELAEVRERATEPAAEVRAAARAVLAGIAAREGEALKALEAEAARRRADLHAIAAYWPPGTNGPLALPTPLAGLLANPPAATNDPPMMRTDFVKQRQRPWLALYKRLAGGDAEADLSDETPVTRG